MILGHAVTPFPDVTRVVLVNFTSDEVFGIKEMASFLVD